MHINVLVNSILFTFLDYQYFILTNLMAKLLSIFEESVKLIGEGKAQQLRRFYENDTLDQKIKDVIRKMEALSSKGSKFDSDLISIAIGKFKDILSIGNTEDVFAIISDQSLPPAFCHSLQEIASLFEDSQKQINSLYDDAFFYKDMLEVANGKKQMKQEDINQKEHISPDKRKSAIMMINKIRNLEEKSQIFEEKEKQIDRTKEITALKAKIMELQLKCKATEEKCKSGQEKCKVWEQKCKGLQERMKKKDFEVVNLEQQVMYIRREKDVLESSLSQEQKELKLKNQELETLKKQIADFDKQQKSVKDNEKKLKDIQKKLKETQRALNEEKKLSEKWEFQLKAVNKQFELYKNENKKIEVDNEIQKRAEVLIESAERFNQFYLKNYSSSQLSLSLKQSYVSQKIELKPFLCKVLSEVNCFKVLRQINSSQSAKIIYQYPQDKDSSLIQKIRHKKNLLIVCSTESGAAFIGYTEVGFKNIDKKQVNKCFVFGVGSKQGLMLRVKKGKGGVREDDDFIVFGDYEFNLQERCGYMATEMDEDLVKQSDFQVKGAERQQLLKELGCTDKRIGLKSYTILQVVR